MKEDAKLLGNGIESRDGLPILSGMSETYVWTEEGWYRSSMERARAEREMFRRKAQYALDHYCKHLPERTLEEVVAILREDNESRIGAVPDPEKYPETRGLDRLIRAEWEGVRKGAELDEGPWQAWCNSNSLYQRRLRNRSFLGSGEKPEGTGRCTYIYLKESDHGPLLANNLDSGRGEPFAAPPWRGINEHLIFGRVSSGVFLDEEQELFPLPIDRLLARYCRSTAEAVELLERYTRFWGPCNALLVDRSHKIAMIEKSACRMGVRFAEDYGFITSMTAEEPVFRAYLDDRRRESLRVRGLSDPCGDTAYWAEADNRRELIKRHLEKLRADPTLEGLRALIQHRSPEGRVAYHSDELPHGAKAGYTLRTSIWKLREAKALWWAIDGDTPSFEARPQEVAYKDVFTW